MFCTLARIGTFVFMSINNFDDDTHFIEFLSHNQEFLSHNQE